MFRTAKNRLRAVAPPAVFLAITYYFGWNAVHGQNGLEAQIGQRAALAQAQQAQKAADDERAAWQTQVADLSGKSVAPDMLDEQARHMLNLAQPNDLVIALPPPGQGE